MTTKKTIESTLEDLFDVLVPSEGKAETEAGEILRAYNRVAYRYYNDGDVLGVDYGNETVNAPARYLAKHSHGNVDIEYALGRMWWNFSSEDYENLLDLLQKGVYGLLASNDALYTNDTEDMWSHFKDEDKDWDEEEWEDVYEDEDEEW